MAVVHIAESVGNRRELVANSCTVVHTADADATQLDSFVASASAVCIGPSGLYNYKRCDYSDD